MTHPCPLAIMRPLIPRFANPRISNALRYSPKSLFAGARARSRFPLARYKAPISPLPVGDLRGAFGPEKLDPRRDWAGRRFSTARSPPRPSSSFVLSRPRWRGGGRGRSRKLPGPITTCPSHKGMEEKASQQVFI